MTALRADCASCFGLCCVALPFETSADFAIDKPAGTACPNLRGDDRCGIHARLREEGFRGCTVYDCFGAGQQVAQVTFGGRDWRTHPELAAPMFATLPIMRQLHELLVYLNQALAWPAAQPLHAALREALDATEQLARGTAEDLRLLDVDAHRAAIAPLLRQASARVRGGGRTDHNAADLVGADLHEADLRAADLRGALLIAADLRQADLRGADLLGADLRDADLRGADLRDALFLVQPQLDAARGDRATRIPDALERPQHWTS